MQTAAALLLSSSAIITHRLIDVSPRVESIIDFKMCVTLLSAYSRLRWQRAATHSRVSLLNYTNTMSTVKSSK